MTNFPQASKSQVMTQAQDNRMRTQHLRDRKRTAARTARETRGCHGGQISKKTILRRLKEQGIQPIRWTKVNATPSARTSDLVPESSVLSGDRLCIQMSRIFIWNVPMDKRVFFCRTGERYADACVVEADRFRGGSVMVSGGILHNVKAQLVTVNGTLNAQKNRNDILDPVVVLFMQAGNGVTILQQDNASPHTPSATTQFLTANNVNVMEWPSMSPDLSPIEHIWDELDRRVRARPNQPTNLPQLQATLLQEWKNLPNIVRRYIRSMRNRRRAVINSKGGHT